MHAHTSGIFRPSHPDPLHYVAMPGARFGKRVSALLLDWLILLFLVPGLAILSLAADRAVSLPAGWHTFGFATFVSTVLILAYAVCYRLGATPGMLVANSRLVRITDGGRISWGTGILRGLTSWVFVASWFWVFNVFIFSDARVEGSSTTDTVVDYTMLTFFAISLVGRLWMLGDRHRQTLFDNLLRVKVIARGDDVFQTD